jgi:hypothetical protein
MICLIIIIIILLVFIKFTSIEGLNTFNGKMAIDDQYFYDKIFDDVIYYPNEYEKSYATNEQIGKLEITGWDRCNQMCKGRCIEYGVTGNSYCFPSN